MQAQWSHQLCDTFATLADSHIVTRLLPVVHCGGQRLAHRQLSNGWDWLSVTSTHFSLSLRIAEISWRFRCVKLLALLRMQCQPYPFCCHLLPWKNFIALSKQGRQRCMPLVWLGHPSGRPYVPLLATAAVAGGDFWAFQWLGAIRWPVGGFASRYLSVGWQWNWFNAFLCPIHRWSRRLS